MNDLVEGCRIEGEITLDGEDAYRSIDVNNLRRRVGMVFQQPNPFPMSVYDNVAFGPRTHGIKKREDLDASWSRACATPPSGRDEGPPEEERARVLRRPAAAPVHRPRPCRGTGSPAHGRTRQRPRPHATQRIEEGIHELKSQLSIVIVTHSMQQAPASPTAPPFSIWAS